MPKENIEVTIKLPVWLLKRVGNYGQLRDKLEEAAGKEAVDLAVKEAKKK